MRTMTCGDEQPVQSLLQQHDLVVDAAWDGLGTPQRLGTLDIADRLDPAPGWSGSPASHSRKR